MRLSPILWRSRMHDGYLAHTVTAHGSHRCGIEGTMRHSSCAECCSTWLVTTASTVSNRGPSLHTVPWLYEHGVAAIATDTWSRQGTSRDITSATQAGLSAPWRSTVTRMTAIAPFGRCVRSMSSTPPRTFDPTGTGAE